MPLAPRPAGGEGWLRAVQIHAAHGYLLSQFLSPYFNRRTEKYGSPIENQARILMQVIRAHGTQLATDIQILVKLNSEDLLDGGSRRMRCWRSV